MEHTSAIASESVTQSLGKAWESTKANIWLLAGFCVLFGIAYCILSLIPLVSFFTGLCSFVFTASMFAAFQNYSRNGKLDFNDFFTWSPRFGRMLLGNLLLIGIGLLLIIPLLIITFIVLGVSFFTKTMPEMVTKDPEALLAFLGPFLLVILFIILIAFVVSIFLFAYFFLLQYTELPLMDALRRSIKIGRNNAGQIILFFFISIGLSILGFLALGIGLVVTIPIIIGTHYYFMRSIIPEEIKEQAQWDFMAEPAPTNEL